MEFILCFSKLDFALPFLPDSGLPFSVFFLVPGLAEASLPLLVHFRSGCHAINRKVDQFAWLTNFDQSVTIGKNVSENLLF